MTYEISKMTVADYVQVHQLWLATPGMGLNNVDDSEDGIARLLARNPETCFVARAENAVVGVILVGNDGRRGYVYHLAVAVKYRKNGIATELVTAAFEALKALQISKVALLIFVTNELGNGFWDKLGFTVREDVLYRDSALVELERLDVK